jgi:DNA (cytosine-5)-methyltransferase 1
MRDGECWEQTTAARTTSESASGFWPTPCATDANPITGGNLYQTKTGTVRHMRPDGKSSNRGLEAAIKWPTPRANDAEKRGNIANDPRNGLPAAVMHFPTPTATQHKGWSANHNRADTDDRLDYTIEREAANCSEPGRLNPTWVEWLMGWPSEWTDLKPLEMDKYREWQQQHGCF